MFYVLKIQKVYHMHVIILLYFEKKDYLCFFEIYKEVRKQSLISQTAFAKALGVSYLLLLDEKQEKYFQLIK